MTRVNPVLPWICGVLLTLSVAPSGTATEIAAATDASPATDLVAEALQHNPELAAARSELEAARQRVAPAGALDDPMLEAGFLNVPVDPLSLRREDMTMKMLGLAQKLPFPGKRGLRRSVAESDAESLQFAVDETANRVARDVRVAFEDLAGTQESHRIVERTHTALEQLVSTTRARFNVGLVSQSDVLEAQTELAMLTTELQQLDRDERVLQSELRRLLGRPAASAPITAPPPRLVALAPGKTAVFDPVESRPQLQSLRSLVTRADKSVELAQREYYPDFDLSLQYGQRDRAPDGMPRDDMVSLTVAVNLPIWRKTRLAPMVAEAQAMRSRAQQMVTQGELETRASFDEQSAAAAQWRATATTYRDSLIPQAQAAAESALAAYRVGKVDFPTLRQAQVRVFDLSRRYVEATTAHNKALAEIDLLTGRPAAASNE